jgi:hypothetical protein
MDLTKTPMNQLNKQQFDEVYNTVEIKYKNTSKWMERDTVLFAALTTGQITQEKYNELI